MALAWIMIVAILSLGLTARGVRLISGDVITHPFRERVLYTPEQRATRRRDPSAVVKLDPRRTWWYRMLSCHWCFGLWSAIAAGAITRWLITLPSPELFEFPGLAWSWWDLLVVPALAATISYAVGFLGDHEAD